MTAAGIAAALAGAAGGVGTVELLATRPRMRRHAPSGRVLRALARLGRRGGSAGGASPGARLAAAGVAVSPRELAAARAGAALVALLAVLPLAWAAPPRPALALLLAAPAAGHLLPGAWLARRARRRAAAVEADLAAVLELLRVAVGAGLSPMRALAEVGRRHPGLLAAELRRAAARRALGLPAVRVIAELERRCPGEGVPALCAALRRAERHGAPLADALAAQARQARARAGARTAEAAAGAAPRIQLVVALVLVPSVLLLVAAALLPALTGG